ncbi:ABC transporter permease [Streptococcus iners]|uniref:ABC transporter permease n=1 Tax=Streptococcus iners subsp. hyiners TaxID=3028083 RepID=A0AA96VJS6_9STRE|nr:ABC transporter permease [Streptococcus sp. 29892]MCK4029559.1 multidrug ABC transporter permease [Streptococcus suis]WNY49388.1 ABC transporter permease [Streptococcus sp. 29892]
MKALFQKRRRGFLGRCSKYLRYVLNDHFVLVLMVFLGFLSLQYRQLLIAFPENTWPLILIVLAISFLILFSGRMATYLEEADQIFLLTREKEVLEEFEAASRRSFVLWSGLQVLLQLLLLPIYLKLGLEIWMVVVYIVVLLVAKYFLVKYQLATYQQQGVLNWSTAIQDEQKRKQTILRFFALFTTVKGISATVKPRRYLDGILRLLHSRQTWFYLYLRAFLRAGDYFGLSLRLFLLILLSLVAIDEAWLSLGLVLVFHYLLLFQLLGLYKHYDYQYLTQLYPLDKKRKMKDFQHLLRVILYGLLVVETVVAQLFIQEKIMVAILPIVCIFLHEVYLPIKLKKID